jgi:hypothetical protein
LVVLDAGRRYLYRKREDEWVPVGDEQSTKPIGPPISSDDLAELVSAVIRGD